ncbi:MAG: YbaK/EbsC family protein [Gammaproteobacteria bacterium]|nr:YbaK/EbsC family protein [Gammaproteobacteria bacterium]
MSIASTVKSYLEGRSVDYELVSHAHTMSSVSSAEAAHVTSGHLAKAVIVKQDNEYMMVVVPSDDHVHLGKLHHYLGDDVGLATEQELVSLFPDCERGAIPPLGTAYRLLTLVDTSLLHQPEVFFESGDHEHLVRVSGEQFHRLLGDAEPVKLVTHH